MKQKKFAPNWRLDQHQPFGDAQGEGSSQLQDWD
jgi:hypothetical protein